ncbi:MAG TPA: IgGFc-binding protein, partial [Candidatus Kapabacteria bacterium]|nr:IgGFc-binding protein [Candidatus Kapabacteria bacterium]
IIASQPNTTVKITLPSSTRTALNKTGTFSVTFNNAGDVYYFTDGADPNAIDRVESTCLSPAGDFTGTHIVSDDPKKPIGVIVSQSHTSEPCGDNECGDFGMEWLPPVCNWDTAYVIAPSISHGGANPGQGEVLRVTFAYNNTVLYKTDANGTIAQGTYDAGTPLFFNDNIKTPYVLSASQPFLVCMITTKPQSCLVGSRGGGANFTFSMAILPGIGQWADYVPFGAADLSAFVQANLYFRQSDEKKLFFNGTPLITPSSIVTKIPGTPYAYMIDTLGSNTYYELRGDSGATIGGVMFGYGQSQVSANNGDRSSHTLNPEMVKSYAHPIVINALPACSPDTTAPHAAFHYSCGYWFPDTAWDDELFPQASGIYDIYLAENRAPDSSFNVQWAPAPSFTLGTNLGVQFGIQVINLADTAVAALHVRDGAGNEWDTILTYAPIHLAAQPSAIDVGSITPRDSVRRSIILTDSGKAPAIFTTMRLAIGQYWKILNPPMFPLTIAPGKSDTLYVQFTAPNSATYECYPDTLIVNLCRQFPIVTMIGCTKKPAIYTSDYDFGCWFIDTIGTGGDTVYSPATKDGIYLASIGVDTLHVTDARIAGLIPTDPSQDFAIMSYFDKTKNTLVNLPDTMPPGDTLFVIVRAHAHLEGDNYAYILFTDDANHYLRDTSLLHICGILPAMVMHDLDYGTHLYATTKDSFAVVKNISNTPFTVERLSPFGPDSAYFVAYPYGQGYIDPTTGVYIQYPDTFFVVYPHFSAADSARYPYRFYARKLGLNVDSVQVANTSNVDPTFALFANVVQPHVWAWSGCLADTLRTGDTATAVVQMGNAGTDILTVDTVSIGGPNPANWSVSGIENTTTVQSVSVPFTLQPGDRASVRLLYTATQNGRPDETVSFTGYDALGRHANDSLASLYGWG